MNSDAKADPKSVNYVFVDYENVHAVDPALIGSKTVFLTLLSATTSRRIAPRRDDGFDHLNTETGTKGQTMEYLIGIFLALGISVGATAIGFDRERSFYPTVLIVIAFLYGLFAILAGSTHALLLELLPGALFVIAAVTGFKKGLWWVVAGLIGHGLFDYVHGYFISNPGVPVYWPGFCGTYDVVAGAYLAFLLKQSRVGPPPS